MSIAQAQSDGPPSDTANPPDRANSGAGQTRSFNISRSSVHDALVEFAHQAALQIAWNAEDFDQASAGPVIGEMSPSDALDQLLSPLGAKFTFTSERVVAIQLVAAPGPAIEIDGEGAQEKADAGGYSPYQLPDRDEIVVTGSRLKPLEEDRRFAPRHALTTTDVRQSGYNDFLNAVVDIPAVNAPVTPENTQTSVPSSGQSFIELRGLGTNRTLVLFDGRRAVSNSYQTNRVDLNTVPIDLVERVEFIKGGASAIHGADAIAGAVNVIFNRSFEGFRIRTRGGAAQMGGGEEFGVSLLYGGAINDGRGNLTFYAGYDLEGAIRATDRDFAVISAEFDPDDNELDVPDFSGTLPGGRFPRPGPDFFFDETGLRDDFDIDRDGFAFRPLSTLSIPQDRFYMSALFEHAIASSAELYSATHWTRMETESVRAPETMSNFDTGALIPLDNPFIPDVIRDDALARGASGIQFRRRMSELGNRGRKADRNTLRHWTGVRSADISGDFYWDLVAGYNRHRQKQSRAGLVDLPNFVEALNVEPDPSNAGSYRCIDAAARLAGCAPLNLFGLGAVSDAAAAYIRHNDQIDALIEQYTVSLSASTTIADLPAGPLDAAFGAEWRRDSLKLSSDPVNAAGETSASPIIPFTGRQSAYDVFAETRLPLIKDHRFAQSLSLSGAARLTFFNEGPDPLGVSYNLSGSWAPISAFKIDVGFARSIREPDLTERFSPPRGDSDPLSDPCDGVSTATNAVTANCLMDPGISAAIASSGVFSQIGTEISGPNAGNRDLSFEKARTFSARASFAPDMPLNPKLIVEYFDVTIDDAIEAFTSNEIAQQCYLRIDPGRQTFCDLITRDSAGQVTEILNQQLNLITLESRGLETEFSASNPIVLFGQNAEIGFMARHSRLFELDEEFDSPLNGGLLDNDIGEPGSPRNALQLVGDISMERFSARWRSQYFGATIDSDSRTELFEDLNITDPLFFNILSNWRHDIYVEWRAADANLKLFAGVNNLLNDTGPFFPSGTIQGGSDNHISEFDVVGRYFFIGLEKIF